MTSAKLIERIVANRAQFEQRQVRRMGAVRRVARRAHHGGALWRCAWCRSMCCSAAISIWPCSGFGFACSSCSASGLRAGARPAPPPMPLLQAKKQKSEAAYYTTSKTYLQEI